MSELWDYSRKGDKPKRKRMKQFRIEELSVVDRPAQEGALATIFKRDRRGRDVMSDYAKALDVSLHTIVSDPSLGWKGKLDLVKQSTNQFLGAVAELSNGSATEMNLSQLRKQMNELGRKLDVVVTKLRQERENEEDDPISKAGMEEDEAAERLRALFGRKEAGAGPSMMYSDDETGKADLDDDEEDMEIEIDDEEEITEEDLLRTKADADKAMDTDEGEGLVTTEGEEEEPIGAGSTNPIGQGDKSTRKRGEDEILKVGDRTISKARVGADMFAVFKAQQEQLQRLEKQADEAIAAREVMQFEKVADEELSRLPGTPLEKARLLRKLAGSLDEGERRLMTKMLRAGDRGLNQAFSSIGHADGRVMKARGGSSFEKRVAQIRARDNCKRAEAMQKARVEYPQEYETYQQGS